MFVFSYDTLTLIVFLIRFETGNNIKVGIEDEYQDTVPFDDTAVLESPSGEPQLVNLDAETEGLDDSECVDDNEKEVVLDSDDDEIDRTQVASVMEGISSAETQRSDGGDILNLEKRQLAPATKRCYVGQYSHMPFEDVLFLSFYCHYKFYIDGVVPQCCPFVIAVY